MQKFFKLISIVSASLFILGQGLPVAALDSSSTSFQIIGGEIDQGGARGTSTSWSLIGTMGQQATGRMSDGAPVVFTVDGGASSYPRCTSPTLTGIPGAGQAILTWTASTCQGGWTLTGYEVCSGASSNTYSACANVGNVLTSTRTATASAATFYRIRAIATGAASTGTPAGNVGSRSDELQVTAGGAGGGGGGGGGGGAPVAVASVTVTAPNGGERLTSGQSTTITWSSSGVGISTIRLKLSGDGGLVFSTTIKTNESNDGTYAWTIPELTGSQFRVMVEGLNSAGAVVISDMSNDNFSIGPSGAVPAPISSPIQQVTPPPPPRISAPSVVNTVTVTLRGVAYPGATVTILRDGTNAGFVTADSVTGAWTMTMPGLTPGGLYTFVFQATDSASRRSATTTRTVNLPTNAPVYEIENLLTPPTIAASATAVKPGESITFNGFAPSGTSLTAELGNLTRTLAIATNGLWEMVRNTTGLSGSFTARARVGLGAEVSSWSTPISFSVSGTPVAPPATKSADLSGDRRVGLTDFSRLVAQWNKPNPPAQVDLNGDGKVNLRDLSILLSKWTG